MICLLSFCHSICSKSAAVTFLASSAGSRESSAACGESCALSSCTDFSSSKGSLSSGLGLSGGAEPSASSC